MLFGRGLSRNPSTCPTLDIPTLIIDSNLAELVFYSHVIDLPLRFQCRFHPSGWAAMLSVFSSLRWRLVVLQVTLSTYPIDCNWRVGHALTNRIPIIFWFILGGQSNGSWSALPTSKQLFRSQPERRFESHFQMNQKSDSLLFCQRLKCFIFDFISFSSFFSSSIYPDRLTEYHTNPIENDYFRGIIWELWRGDYSLRNNNLFLLI